MVKNVLLFSWFVHVPLQCGVSSNVAALPGLAANDHLSEGRPGAWFGLGV